jgi:chaperonin GroES
MSTVTLGTKDLPKLAVQIEPLGDRVVVQPLEKEEVTASGIVIPETASGEKPQEGIVIALGNGGVGKDCANPSEFLSVGDKVLFGKYAGDDVKLKTTEGKDIEVKILHLDSVLGKVS